LGEIIGILFVLGTLGTIGYLAYRDNCCPECGGFRSLKNVEVTYTPVDNEIDAKDFVLYLLSEGEHRSKSSIVNCVKRCEKCGYEIREEGFYKHY